MGAAYAKSPVAERGLAGSRRVPRLCSSLRNASRKTPRAAEGVLARLPPPLLPVFLAAALPSDRHVSDAISLRRRRRQWLSSGSLPPRLSRTLLCCPDYWNLYLPGWHNDFFFMIVYAVRLSYLSSRVGVKAFGLCYSLKIPRW